MAGSATLTIVTSSRSMNAANIRMLVAMARLVDGSGVFTCVSLWVRDARYPVLGAGVACDSVSDPRSMPVGRGSLTSLGVDAEQVPELVHELGGGLLAGVAGGAQLVDAAPHV